MQAFAAMLDFVAGRVVVDPTGLTGRYEFSVRFSPPGVRPGGGPDDPPDFFAAVQSSWGSSLGDAGTSQYARDRSRRTASGELTVEAIQEF